jgi:HEAT repeat protein
MPRAARRPTSVPRRSDPRPEPVQVRSPRWRAPILVVAVAVGCFALGQIGPDLRALGAAPAAFTSPVLLQTPGERPDYPREAAALRLELDEAASPARVAELVERLGILGDEGDFNRLADLAEHPNGQISHAAMRSLARIGGDRAIDRLTVFARANEDTSSIAAIQALGLAMEPEAVDVLLEVAKKSTDWRQNLALQALATRGGKQARNVLHRGLKSAPANNAYGWANAVASLGEAADRFLLMTLASGSGPRADAALSALAGLGSADSDSLLIELAKNARGNRRITALSSLGTVRDPRAVEVLIEALGGTVHVRSAALGALGISRAPGALDGLLLAIDNVRADEAWQVTSALVSRPERQAREVLKLLAAEEGPLGESAMASLAQAGDPAASELLLTAFDERGELPPETAYQFLAVHGGEDGWSLLEEVLADGSTAQQHSVVYALQSRGDEHAVTRLLDIARGDDPWISASAMGALENLGDDARDDLRGVLLERLEDGEGFAEAAPALARLGGDKARDALLGRLSDGTSSERSAALQALGQMDDEGAQAALRETLGAEDPNLRRQAFEAMIWSGQPMDMDTVSTGLADSDPTIRSQAVNALANMGDPAALDQLMDLSNDEDPSVRMSAVSALGTVGGADAEAGLVDALADPELFDTALWSLSSMGTSGAREAIREAAGDDDPGRRMNALSALSNDRSPAARELLTNALHDDDPGVVTTALGQLQMVGSSSAADAVAALLSDLPDGDDPNNLRWQAANALQSIGGRVAREHQDLITSVLGADPWTAPSGGYGHMDWEQHPEIYLY